MSRVLLAVAILAIALGPELAHACAVCGAGASEDESRIAYLVTTAVLSALPLALFGGIVLWLRARSRAASRTAAVSNDHVH